MPPSLPLDKWQRWNWNMYLPHFTVVSSRYRKQRDNELVVVSQILVH